jgi:hypothetical protein
MVQHPHGDIGGFMRPRERNLPIPDRCAYQCKDALSQALRRRVRGYHWLAHSMPPKSFCDRSHLLGMLLEREVQEGAPKCGELEGRRPPGLSHDDVARGKVPV